MIYVLLMVGVLGARGAEFSLPLVVLLLLDVSTKTCPDRMCITVRLCSSSSIPATATVAPWI